MTALLRSLRPLHWTKNVLVFAPVILAHRTNDLAAMTAAALAFIAFSLAASGTYLINDVRDLEFDRLHPNKRNRSVASGAVSPKAALILCVVLIAAGVAIALSISLEVFGYLAGYFLLSLIYSLWLKRRVFLDVLALSALWTIRVLAGSAAARVEASDWLLALSVFLFVGLALLKRYADLGFLAVQSPGAAPGRGYVTGDRDLLRSMGVTSGYLAVLVLALYLNSPQVARLYASPRLLWLVCPLMLYWIAHMWFLAHRGAIQDDPIVVAARDPASYVTGALIALVIYAAI
ncbi:MAG TPA: UbiA family prenyltransferase [Thermoanaerobaculia bacterium]|nr:UbiA family prenyltransferase [Thermoanaerobaculia bacterium]